MVITQLCKVTVTETRLSYNIVKSIKNSGKQGNYWVLADNDFDSREPLDLIKVQPFEID